MGKIADTIFIVYNEHSLLLNALTTPNEKKNVFHGAWRRFKIKGKNRNKE